jgi:glyoxylase-like metal-dependent hydrolase (beta-lactamase superfamily II)
MLRAVRTISAVTGNSQKLDGGAMFGNAPKPVWERWIAPDEKNRIPLACRAMLVEDDGRKILLETGIGAFFDPKLKERYGVVEDEHVLLRSLGELGLTDADIDVVVLSHLHFDHAGGLLAAYEAGAAPRLLFPKARFVVGARAWERATHPHARDRASFVPELNALLEASGRLEIVVGETSSLLDDGFRFHASDGHTPGLMLTEVAMPDGPVVFAGDLVPGRAWVHLPITMGYDRYPELLIDEKRALFEALVPKGLRLFYTHDPEVALTRVEEGEKGRYVATHPVVSPRRIAA